MKYTTVKISEIRKHPTMRLDAGYWIKKNQKKKKATSYKPQAPSLTVSPIDDRIHLERGNYVSRNRRTKKNS
jgi:hypothetical protein